MISFPNAKINIGLNVLNKRPDGYHNIESLFYPIPLQDVLEIIPTDGEFEFSDSGIVLDCNIEDNIVVKAFRLMQEQYKLPNVRIHLHKNIPFGAGLGGGSSDAAFALKMINEMFDLQLAEEQLIEYSLRLGADCAFFIKNKPQIVGGIGDVFSETDIDLKGKYILLVKPDIVVPTPLAYKYVVPQKPAVKLEENLTLPFCEWKEVVRNDFEVSVFKQYLDLLEIKEALYKSGAVYAAMSGSGSSIFGIFEKKPQVNAIFASYFCFEAVL